MPEIQVKKGEPIDRALKRLKSKIETEGTLEEFRRRRQHETPTERTKRKARSAAKKKNQKFRFVP
ncbi:MAG TPA: 30S ribosomal protein S21 [Verrucomicrobiales bacterium]|jgi:small subunit ribosomal protein S21|nr:30S ribosomal protein S21 [Verrucomicrobiales bacterium]